MTITAIDYRLHILWRMWRNDRIAGNKDATRRDLAEFDKLLDQRLQLRRNNGNACGRPLLSTPTAQ